MADAYCGPSNALQNFKQHTQSDRSLQQDRLVGPRGTVQGFRTQDPRAASLDAEFHAFENAAANPFQEPMFGNNVNTQARFQQPNPSDWASDFQQLRISDHPVPAQQFRTYAPLVKSTNGWHGEFMMQQPGLHSSVAQGKQVAHSQENMSLYTPQVPYHAGFGPMSSFGTQMNHFSVDAQIQDNHQLATGDWSQAFEEAFRDASKDADQLQHNGTSQQVSNMEENNVVTTEPVDHVEKAEQIRIGSDAIDYTEKKDKTADQESQDANALARVAGELLHNVQHDSSEKFQNSQFLDLMRKIRDRQVEVRNNDFETTAPATESFSQVNHDVIAAQPDVQHMPDPVQDKNTFAFPSMNAVYAPHAGDFVDYSFDSDQYPSQSRTQNAHLHPGGRLYPEQSPPGAFAQMSGAVTESSDGRMSTSISVADFEAAAYDENRELASRFRRTSA